MPRLLTFFILMVILLVILTQIYFILKERYQLKKELANLSSKLDSIINENAFLKSEINYFSYPENLEKELRSKFNYKKPGEEMIIITP